MKIGRSRRSAPRRILSIEPPKRVARGWLVRLRVCNPGGPTTFGVEVFGVDGARSPLGESPWLLPWRGHEEHTRVHLETGGEELVRLALFRPAERDVVLFRAPCDGRPRHRRINVGGSELVLSARVRRGDEVVADERVLLSLHDADEATPPIVTFAPAGSTVTAVKVEPVGPSATVAEEPLMEEARRFGEQDNHALRAAGWGSIPYIQRRVTELVDIVEYIRVQLEGRDCPRALTLACGDMTIEYGCFKRAGVAEIDAFDISEGQRDKFFREVYDGRVAVNYHIGDANRIELEPNTYDVAYLYNGYHHVEALEHVADQISRALKPNGILAIQDYIGANSLQRTERQMDLCGAIWRALPERYRVSRDGKVERTLRNPNKKTLPPFEAIRSQDILDVLRARFEVREIYLYGGILFPLFQGFAHCYTDSEEDQRFVRLMWDLDRWLVDTGAIEPNFVKAILAPRGA